MLIPDKMVRAEHLVDGAVLSRSLAPGLLTQGIPVGIRPPVHIESLDVVADWPALVNCTTAADANNWLAGKTAFQSLKVTASGGGTAISVDRTFTPIDLSGTFVHLRIYVHPGAGTADPVAKFINAGIYLNDSSNRWSNSIGVVNFFDYGLDGAGWYDGVRAVTAAELGTCDVTDVRKIRLSCKYLAADATVSVTFDRLAFLPVAPKTVSKPVWVVTMDDVLSSDYQDQGIAYAAALGIPMTIYATTTWTNAARLARLRLHHRFSGHLVGNHGYSHAFWSTGGLTEAEKFDEFYRAAAWLQENGLGVGARHWAQPGGTAEAFGSNIPTKWLGIHMRTCRLTDMIPGWWGGAQPGLYPVSPVSPSMDSAASAQTALDALIVQGNGYGLGGFHCNSVALLTELKTHLDYLKTQVDAGNVYAVTLETLSRGWTPPV